MIQINIHKNQLSSIDPVFASISELSEGFIPDLGRFVYFLTRFRGKKVESKPS
ncbi:10529_t:CDS:2 [Funneliformis geosporum]|uniref:10529_t:CDS:1 n=1 Tax=Funneliformis geosporum TaxID=1117311 RepID=A0A9W4SWI7_9GLOM|nr:10529_t:CDS:2 [Funneliformis geosporum]